MMLVGEQPFDSDSIPKLISQIASGYYDQEALEGVSEEAQDLISKMLEVDPEERISAREALSHPWF